MPSTNKSKEPWSRWTQECEELAKHAMLLHYGIGRSTETQYTELHTFADASQAAYGAVSYLRNVDKDGKINEALAFGKSRLAPLWQQRIPRMELCAARQETFHRS